ncbi:gluconeogenesis factor YvcK family protein [Tissierella creatinophila]|uniref:Putative gluconeogenesis factor n=1 Tax=Tissierella creatinophila DSM 6911 TaxID=1123403 RepID=A0A1U7M7N7_TISCR|nr:gluconeogenesis factor YvcK family protein [Tissierella creatinophila]OLS03295.1 gluconeogenesis factor [Tissierella creatinophila DSM 6911]
MSFKKERYEPKVVVVGGGTGLSILLKGLKEFTKNITAIVTVADDGGGSGVLREDLGMLPPGDIRACMLALANTEPTMEKLFQYRFEEGMLKGQSFGNIFIAAMNGIYGNFETAIKESSNVLAITGKVYPMTLDNVRIKAELQNGKMVEGESYISIESTKEKSKIKKVSIDPEIPKPLPEAIESIKEADIIVLGPGSLYTSVIPNLLVKDIVEAIVKSPAPKAYIVNVMTEPGETDDYKVLEHVQAILDHSRDDLLNYVIANTQDVPIETLEKYIHDGSVPVKIQNSDEKTLAKKGITLIANSLIDIKKDYIRHDNINLSKLLVQLAKSRP